MQHTAWKNKGQLHLQNTNSVIRLLWPDSVQLLGRSGISVMETEYISLNLEFQLDFNLIGIASNLRAMASNLEAIASNVQAITSNLEGT